MKTTAERFWAKVTGGNVDTCWEWTASKARGGYGRLNINGRTALAHRWAYEHLIAPIPQGLDLDHLCRNRACVNPWHLDPVTRGVNLRRGQHWESAKTHCHHGHPFTEENTYLTPAGHRECRECRLAASRRHAPKKREYMTRWHAARKLATDSQWA
jgi:hypothetical protein